MSTLRKLQFNLHLIDPNEYIFNSFNSYVYIDSPYTLSYKCKLYICSNGLSFECNNSENTTTDIIRIYYKHLNKVQPSNNNNTNNLLLQCSDYIVQYSIRQPWTFVSQKSFVCTFQLSSNDLSIVLQLINQCNMCARLNDTTEAQTLMSDIVLSYHSTIQFDVTHIVDINEKSILNFTNTAVTKSLIPIRNNNVLYCNTITPLLSIASLCYITNKRIYIQPCNNLYQTQVYKLSQFTTVYKRRYAMKYSSIELMFKPSTNTQHTTPIQSLYIQFTTNEQCNAVYIALKSYIDAPSIQQSLTTLLQQWHNKSIDNYTYLLQLNIIAGRSFNDLSQYPVFPWLLNEYVYNSDVIDLTDTIIYRDLATPIGKLNEQRFTKFKERYIDMLAHTADHSHSVPPFLYGSFYSTLGYVLYYLVRQYPEWMLNLQHGVYDKPDRLFSSISAAYNSVLTAPTDLKELIPQFYDTTTNNNTTFLLNNYKISFGTTQDGAVVNDVLLPQWANNAQHFIETMRAVLESDYVSNNIHQWIDLIFGANAHGTGAVKADNVFYYLTYAVSSNNNDGEHTVNQLNEFGQVPIQLFYTPHPTRSTQLDDIAVAQLITPSKLSNTGPTMPIAKPVQQRAQHNNNTSHVTQTLTNTINNAATIGYDVANNTRSWMSNLLSKQ